jgi:RIO kinase 1
MYIDGVLLMELVTDFEGNPAPRLGDLEFSARDATEIYYKLIREAARMLAAGVVHGDLSDFNVLLAADGPVVIDFPQSISAAGNLNARSLFLRDVNNLHRFLERWVPGVRRRPYGEEMWELYEKNELTAETKLTGKTKAKSGPVDTSAVLSLIGDANRDEAARRRALGKSTEGLEEKSTSFAGRRREIVIERPQSPRRDLGICSASTTWRPRPAGRPSRGGRAQRRLSTRPESNWHLPPPGSKRSGLPSKAASTLRHARLSSRLPGLWAR